MDNRKIKGMLIAKTQQIRKTEKGYIVPSQSGNGSYVVAENRLFPDIKECTCQEWLNGKRCSHYAKARYKKLTKS